MKFIIHFSWPDGTDDSICIEGDTVDDVRERAKAAMLSRGINESTCWSEEVK